jgi:hypothetical protein
MSQGLSTIYTISVSGRGAEPGERTGNNMCPPATIVSGSMTPHELPGIYQAGVTIGCESTIIMTMNPKQMMNATRKRAQIRGTSIQKFERSTSCGRGHRYQYRERI